MLAARVGAILTFFLATSVAGVMTTGGAAYADSPTAQVAVQSNDSAEQVREEPRVQHEGNNANQREKRHKTPHKKDCSDPRYASYHVYKCTKKQVKDSPHKAHKPPKKHTKPQPAPVHKTDVNSENNGEISIGTGSSGTQHGNAATNAGSNATTTGSGNATSKTDVDVDIDNSKRDDHRNSGNTKVVNSGNSKDDHSVKVGGHNNAVGHQPIGGHDNVVGDQNVVGTTTTVTQSETKVDKSTTVIDKSVTSIDQSVTNIDNSVHIVNVDNSVHTVNNTTIVQQQQVVHPKAHSHKRGHAGYATQTVKVKDGKVQATQSLVIKTTPNKQHKKSVVKQPKKVTKTVIVKPVAHAKQVVQQASPPYIPGKTLALTGADVPTTVAIGGGALFMGVILLLLGVVLPRRRVVSPTESH